MSNARVLIIATEDADACALAGYLEGKGLQVEIAAGGAEALNAFHKDGHGVIIVDLDLPSLQLEDFLDGILFPRPDTRIIAITSKEDASRLANAVECGVSGYMTKPVDEEALLRQVEKA